MTIRRLVISKLDELFESFKRMQWETLDQLADCLNSEKDESVKSNLVKVLIGKGHLTKEPSGKLKPTDKKITKHELIKSLKK